MLVFSLRAHHTDDRSSIAYFPLLLATQGYRALLGPGFEPATHPLKPVDIRTHEALSEPLPRQKPEADFEQGVVLTRAVGNLFASCHDATSSLTPLHEVSQSIGVTRLAHHQLCYSAEDGLFASPIHLD
jgi:hypothetical protein